MSWHFPARLWQTCCLAGFLFAQSVPLAAAVEIENVSVRRLDAEHFKRVSEYFTGEEAQGRRIIARTDADERGGLYFVVELSDPAAELPAGTKIRVRYFQPDQPDQHEQVFALPADRLRFDTLYLGLTGGEWPNPRALPLAFRVSLEGPDGAELEAFDSFLWK